jgi:hypothetical protein
VRTEQRDADLEISLALDADAPRAARHHIARVDRPSPDLRDAVALLTSELISQAVLRCHFVGVAFDLYVWMPSDLVRVEIRLPASFLELGWENYENDLGTLVMRHVADRLSVDSRDGMACMWFEIDRQRTPESMGVS